MSVVNTEDDSTTPIKTADEQKATQKPQTTKNTIMVDGPLSAVYAQALRLIYGNDKVETSETTVANETAQIDVAVIMDLMENLPDDIKEQVDDGYTYVYSTNTSDLKNSNVATEAYSKVTSRLADGHCRKVVVALECDCVITDRIGVLDQYFRSNGATVIYKRNNLITAVR